MQKSLNNNSVENIPTADKYKELKAWGLYSSVDIHNCDPEFLQNDEMVKQYVIQLCDILKIKRNGEAVAINAGDNKYPCYSMTHLDESLITIHFSDTLKTTYIDVFSSNYYDPEVFAHFSICYFRGSKYNLEVLLRK